VEPQRSLIADVENAIASGSSERRLDTLRRVTDLFMVSADDYSEIQVDLFDDVISRLADNIELKARAELANRLAPVRNAPTEVVRSLARDSAIEVCGPVLSQSPRLTDEDLLACASSNNQQQLLAISKRDSVSEAVSDVLVTRGDREVVRSVARNDGARFSSSGYGVLVDKSSGDDELAFSVGSRTDIPKEQFHALVSKASETVFRKLAASNPAAIGEVNRILFDLTGRKAGVAPRAPRDYAPAKAAFDALLASGKPIEPVVQAFASTGKFEETVVALATLCSLPLDVVERVLGDRRADNDLALLLIKAAGLTWPTAKLILELRRGEGGLAPQALAEAYQHFDRLQIATARRVVRFYQVRQTSSDKGA